MATHQITFTLNTRQKLALVPVAYDAAGVSARGIRSDRHEKRLRDRRMRRVYGAAER